MKTALALIALIVLMAASPAQAEVFKCKNGENKTVYQSAPCIGAVEVTPVEIKRRSAEKEAAAVAALKQWQDKHEAEEAAEKAAMQAEHDRKLREAEVNAAERNARAQDGQWEAEHRQANAMEQGKAGSVIIIGR